MHKININGQSFLLRKIKKEDVEQVRRLADSCVGENLYSSKEIASAIDSSDRFFYLLQDQRGEAVGYIYYYITTEERIAEYSKLDEGIFQALPFNHGGRVGKIQSVGVDHEYRGMGISTKMMEFVLDELKKLSIEAVFIVCWKPKGTIQLQKAITECAFSFLSIAKNVWYNDTRLICPYCKGRCTCDAEVYYKLLLGDES
ncbi:GNAT family N-acetyltransferase [Bullifex porci]|uniref:GNAT family N-acetyltransferase n=1 Tax=Bullifex porci TaxID=2606638 RepID=UPI0023F0D968|nr:GNAT family N-acetyltransferase [Bullifex porci]MDD7256577.1 GNAT family N-acetyltransferase [Bullifex porci]MDD7588092.1 GNAT family N-acetyltransferase [Bullifex porci]MDY2742200.1 GNAT family N-acetyltransferase [Bullifex porci]